MIFVTQLDCLIDGVPGEESFRFLDPASARQLENNMTVRLAQTIS